MPRLAPPPFRPDLEHLPPLVVVIACDVQHCLRVPVPAELPLPAPLVQHVGDLGGGDVVVLNLPPHEVDSCLLPPVGDEHPLIVDVPAVQRPSELPTGLPQVLHGLQRPLRHLVPLHLRDARHERDEHLPHRARRVQ